MHWMFNSASAFNQDLGWCVVDVVMAQASEPGTTRGGIVTA